jgi:hypothetical protein
MDCVHGEYTPQINRVREITPQICLCHKHIECFEYRPWRISVAELQNSLYDGILALATIDNTEHIKHCYQI